LVGRFGFFSSWLLPPLGSLLPSDLAQCAIELPLLALLRVLLGPPPWRAVRHWSSVIGKRRFKLFTQISRGQLRRLRHSGPFEKPAHAVRTKKASERAEAVQRGVTSTVATLAHDRALRERRGGWVGSGMA
jgi:hypothetical protein